MDVRDNGAVMRKLKARFFEEGKALDAAGDPAANCWICGGRIDYSVTPGSTDYSHNLDHFYPVSRYPDLQRDPANFRHSHRVCNYRRGNGVRGPDSLGDMWRIYTADGRPVELE